MGNENINIRIGVLLNQATSVSNIDKQIKEIQAKFKGQSIKLNLDTSSIVKQYGQLKDGSNGLKSTVFKATDALGQQYQMTYKLDQATGKFVQSNVKLSSSFKKVSEEAEKSGQSFLSSAKKFGQWMVVGSLIMQPFYALKNGIGYLIDLDTAMNQVRIVTNKSKSSVDELALSYNKLGREMSVTTAELANTSADLYRQGLNDSDVEARMKGIIEYAKISSISLEQANQIITSSANATGESAQKIIDIFSMLGDTTASDASEVGEAMQRVASAAENSNLSLEKTASWISTISSITRESASTIGRSISSSIARYESIKSTGFNSEDSTALNDVTTALTSIGIQAVDSKGQLREYGDVMDEVGAKYNSLSKNEQAYIVTTMFGTYQRNRGLTLLSHYQDSLKNYENALNSAGTAEQKFAIYQESATAHIDSFKNAMESLWQNSFNSDQFKSIIDFGTTLVDAFNKILNNGLTPLILMMGTGAGTVNLLSKSFISLKGAMASEAMTAFSVKLLNLVATEGIVIGTTKALTTTLLASPLFWGAVGAMAIYGLVKAVDYLTVSFAEQNETVETLSSDYQSITSDIASLNDKLKTSQDRLTELNSQDSLTIIEEDEKKKLQDTNDELARQLRIKESLERIKKAELQDTTIKLLEMESETIQTGNKVLKQVGAKTAQLAPETKSVTKLESVDYNIDKLNELKNAEKNLQEQQDNLDRKSKDYDKTSAKLGEQLDSNAKKQSDVKTALSETAEFLSKQADNLDTTTDAGKKYKEQIDNTITSIDEMINGLSSDKMPDWYKENIKANKDMVNHFKEDYDIDLENYNNLADAKKDIELLATNDIGKILDTRISEMNEKYNVDVKNYANATEAKIKMEQALLTAKAKSNAKQQSETNKNLGIDAMSGADSGVKLTSQQRKDLANLDNYSDTSDYKSALDEINKIYGTYKSSPTAPSSITPSGSKDKKSESAISHVDESQAIVDTINQQVKLDNIQNDSLSTQIKIAENAKDYTKQIELQNQLLSAQQKTVTDLKSANDQIHAQAQSVRSSTKYNTDTWFNADNTDTTSYIALLNTFEGKTDDASKKAVEDIQAIHDKLKTLKDGWGSNKDAIDSMNSSIMSVSDSIEGLSR